MQVIKISAVALVLSLLVADIAMADQVDDGLAAQAQGDFATALALLRPVAEQGDARAQNSLGIMFAHGSGVPLDPVEARKWYLLSAAQGYGAAQFNLGQLHRLGQGVPKDYAEAAKWYRLAAEQGYVEACFNLGVMFAIGDGVALDNAEAVK